MNRKFFEFKYWGRLVLVLANLLLATCESQAVGSWTALASAAPGGVQNMLLLTDGTVLCQNQGGTIWYKLTPNGVGGSYVNGSWTTMASMGSSRRFFVSAMLQSGRVLVAGGEYGTGGANSEIYDPVANTWTPVPTPAALFSATGVLADGSNNGFRDPCSVLLPNGDLMVAPVLASVQWGTVIYSVVSNTWTTGPACRGNQNEASWIKLPDDSILTIDTASQTSERYIPASRLWIADANVPQQLYGVGSEIGPGLLLPDGRALFIGATGLNVFYTPSGNTSFGTWSVAAPLPNNQGAPDAPAAVMVNGKILAATSAPMYVSGTNTIFPTPTSFYELNPTNNIWTQVNAPAGGQTVNIPCYKTTMLALPSGQVLYSDYGTQLYVYTPDGTPLAAGKPTIASVTPKADGTYRLTGTLLNGLNAGAAYGDDLQMDSNYPLVRLHTGGNVYYCRTTNWSSTSVMTGSAVLGTDFSPSGGLTPGWYNLVTVANGIASDPVGFYGPVWVDFNYAGFENGVHDYPWNSLAEGVAAVDAGGTINFRSAGHKLEPMTINKAMELRAVGGPVTLGN